MNDKPAIIFNLKEHYITHYDFIVFPICTSLAGRARAYTCTRLERRTPSSGRGLGAFSPAVKAHLPASSRSERLTPERRKNIIMAEAMEVVIEFALINVIDNNDDDVYILLEVGYRAPCYGNQDNDDVAILMEWPRQSPVCNPQPNFGDERRPSQERNDAADDDVIYMDAASCDMFSDRSLRSSISDAELSEANGSVAGSGLGGSSGAEDRDSYASPERRGACVTRSRGERAPSWPEDLPLRERELLEYLMDGFRSNFPIVEDCDHALLWAFILLMGASRDICCLDNIRDYPGLREVLVHKTGLKRALREQCANCPGCRLPTWRMVGARHCDLCKRVIVLNQDAIHNRRILKSSPPDVRR
ncbi:unnamed protein product [Trichogramma brassicae]|uniref:Uncharacterized protein n=1 Tax=Trichogramma brassicae TaxID=86971 RepID=A0A6H5IML4_9HYME|nr:unnamed protein product [Trichogramma brassicae]